MTVSLRAILATALVAGAVSAYEFVQAPAAGADPSLGKSVSQASLDEFMTGAEPIDPAEYDQLPKIGTFRAWLPKRVDLTQNFPKPGYQGQQPNCVAWATTYAARTFFVGRELGMQPDEPDEQMSPAYVYNRLRRPGSQCDKTVRIVDALNLLQREGTVTLAEFPDDLSKCPIAAPQTLKTRAAENRLASWRAIDREAAGGRRSSVVLDDIKGAMSRSEPVVFAMPVMDDFKALRGDVVYTHLTPERTNFHAMTVAGYDEDRQAFRVINSWGDHWGDSGYAWIGYDTFKLLVTEAYVLQDTPDRVVAPSQKPALLSPRQNLDALAARIPCGSVRIDTSGPRLTVSGFGGSSEALGELRAAALAVDPRAAFRVERHGWPQCEAQLTLASQIALGGVTLTAQEASGKVRRGDPITMKEGEFFGISASTPPGKPHLSIIYLQADGSAVELYRGSPAADARGNGNVTIGLEGAREARYQVAPPLGDEIVIALASDRPLFGNELEDYKTERQFLTALRAKLTTLPSGAIAASVLRIRTRT